MQVCPYLVIGVGAHLRGRPAFYGGVDSAQTIFEHPLVLSTSVPSPAPREEGRLGARFAYRRPSSRCSSRSMSLRLMVSRLSYWRLPRASPISSFALPLRK